MKIGQIIGELVDQIQGKTSCRQLPVEQRLLREAGHLHRILDCLAIPGQARCIGGAGDRDYRQIKFRGQTTVETQFLLAITAASGEGAEIEKSQRDRLLDLVGVGAAQQHVRNVRLDHLDLLGRMRITDGVA